MYILGANMYILSANFRS